MDILNLRLVLILALASSILAEKFSFDNYKLIRINPQIEAHLEIIANWEDNLDVKYFILHSRIMHNNIFLIFSSICGVKSKQ